MSSKLNPMPVGLTLQLASCPRPPGYPTRRACRPVAATAQSTCAPPPPPLSPPLRQLAESSPSYAAILTTQDIIVQHLTDSLQLSPTGEGSAAPGGLVEVEAAEGGAGARVRCLTGQDVRWLSASTLGRGDVGFGGTIVTGFCDGASDTPHFLLEQTLHGGSVLLVVALWPRRDWMVDGAYLQRYYGSAPPGDLRDYNAIYNACTAAAEERPGWRRYQSPELVVKPMLSTAMAYTFDATEENLCAARELALEVAVLWAAFVQGIPGWPQGELGQRGDPEVQRYDERYIASVLEDPGNEWAAKLFGREATNRLVAAMHGSADAAPLF